MPAANTDLLRKYSRRWVGQIGAGGVADASVTTVPLSSTTNLATDTAVTVVIDRVDISGTTTPNFEETVIGVVSGSNLVSCIRGVEGTAQAHSAGAVVEVLVTADSLNDLIDHLLVGHTQLGAHIASLPLTTPKITTSINDSNGNEVIKTPATGSAVNEITVTNAATGNDPLISATGGDTNIGLKIASKGAKSINMSTGWYQAAQAYTPSGAGTTTLDLSLGNEHIVTMPADTQTIAISNYTVGQKFIVSINNVTSQGALTWFTTIRWASGTAPTLTGTNAKRDTFGFIVTGAATYDGFIVGQNI